MMNKRGDFSFGQYLLGFLFVGAVISLFALMASSMGTQYNNPNITDQNFTDKYSQFNEYVNKTETIKNALNQKGGIQVVNVGFGIFQASFTFIQLVLSSLGLMGEPVMSFTSDFGIPYQISAIIMVLFTASIAITLIIRIFGTTGPGRWS